MYLVVFCKKDYEEVIGAYQNAAEAERMAERLRRALRRVDPEGMEMDVCVRTEEGRERIDLISRMA